MTFISLCINLKIAICLWSPVFEYKITFWICVLVLWIHKGYCVVKKLVWNVRIKSFWYTKDLEKLSLLIFWNTDIMYFRWDGRWKHTIWLNPGGKVKNVASMFLFPFELLRKTLGRFVVISLGKKSYRLLLIQINKYSKSI